MEFLSKTENIRNICILAHVDHGKTTIADSLISSNGIISHKMAGKIRYLDDRPEEQERGITMKSSSIALKYIDDLGQKFLINLIDTPGHVDFCGEVSAAVRLCDGALIVVDVVEGVCPQTKAALEQAWNEGIEPILVLNKIDRLILEQRLDVTAAYLRLNQLLEQINAIVATLLTTELFEDKHKLDSMSNHRRSNKSESENLDGSVPKVYDWASAIEDIDDDQYYFMPEKNNVIFSSSIDDWGFTIDTFAKILAEKHKINLDALRKTLWGDFYIDVKQKRINRNAQAKAKKNLFTTLVLENIWKIYSTVNIYRNKEHIQKICAALDIQLSARDLNHSDSRYQTRLIMSTWLKLSKQTLDCVSKKVPSPKNLSEKRIERLLSTNVRSFSQLPPESKKLKVSFEKCSYDDDMDKIACISKMIPVDKANLFSNKHKNVIRRRDEKSVPIGTNEDCRVQEQPDDKGTTFMAFARVFSGKLKKRDKLYVLGPRHDPSNIPSDFLENIDDQKKLDDLGPNEHVTIATIEDIYLLMGKEFERIDYAMAGNIVGIIGLDAHLVRTATISSDIYCPPFNDLHLPAAPILRVAIEPKNPADTPALMTGLKLLNQADPCVEVRLKQSGEHVIIATGEVHLQHCIKDLRERYTDNIELNVSQPIVPFRETIIIPPRIDMVNETIDDSNTVSTGKKASDKDGIIEVTTPNRRYQIKLKASPLPEEIIECMSEKQEELRLISKLATASSKMTSRTIEWMDESSKAKIKAFKVKLEKRISSARSAKAEWRQLYSTDMADRIWSFGPKYCGLNILLGNDHIQANYNLWNRIEGRTSGQHDKEKAYDYIDSFISGFQLATQSGPLCEEPMCGVCFTILDWSECDPADVNTINDNLSIKSSEVIASLESQIGNIESMHHDSYGPLSGQIISTVKDCCRKAFQAQPQRLMSPMFSCDIQVTTEALGKMYAVLGRRHGRIIHGDMREGSQTFEIRAFIPVIESLDFVNEIRNQTSGMAYPQLIFSHYEIIDVDPFWTPSTEEEYALFGEKADTENRARKYMNLVRKRKGLAVKEKIVEHAEKQRTIKRNK